MTVRVRRVRCGEERVTGDDATVSAMDSEVPARWWFVGASGSGKSTYADLVARHLAASHIELDALFHQANWTPLDSREFRRQVRDAVSAPAWVLDGNYSAVRCEVIARAQVVVMLDMARWRVTSQIVRRTFRRAVRHEVLWNGNREPFFSLLRWDPMKSVVRYSWTTHHKVRERFRWLETLAASYGAHVIRVRSHEQARHALGEFLGVSPDTFLR